MEILKIFLMIVAAIITLGVVALVLAYLSLLEVSDQVRIHTMFDDDPDDIHN